MTHPTTTNLLKINNKSNEIYLFYFKKQFKNMKTLLTLFNIVKLTMVKIKPKQKKKYV